MRRAFTLLELLVVLVVVLLLAATVVPYAASLREDGRRVACRANLERVRDGLRLYADENRSVYPRVTFEPTAGDGEGGEAPRVGWAAFTGPDDGDPFSPAGGAVPQVAPNDVTASLWLLVRGGQARPAAFVCPGGGGTPDPMTDAAGDPVDPARRGNFRSRANLSYSYADPFGLAPGYGLTDTLPSEFAVLADANPGPPQGGWPAFDAAPLDLAAANSPHHGRAGQNVLYPAGDVYFKASPYVGVNQTKPAGTRPLADGDNVYTALRPAPLYAPETPDLNAPGVYATDAGPAHAADSFLVP